MAYEKFRHPASRYAVVGVAAIVQMDGAVCRGARIAMTGAAASARRITALETALTGQRLDAASIAAACQGLVTPDDLLADAVASSEYRAHLVDVLAKRALTRALGLA
jgi:carbon-monoxide dehydrogenase medium subunit